jgi:hypothetical protein
MKWKHRVMWWSHFNFDELLLTNHFYYVTGNLQSRNEPVGNGHGHEGINQYTQDEENEDEEEGYGLLYKHC